MEVIFLHYFKWPGHIGNKKNILKHRKTCGIIILEDQKQNNSMMVMGYNDYTGTVLIWPLSQKLLADILSCT